jgi:hypothetical protein
MVLFKILNSLISIFMSNILFCHGYATNEHNEWYKKILKSLKAWGTGKSPISEIFASNLISDQYAAIFFVRGIHNKKENEILSFRTL